MTEPGPPRADWTARRVRASGTSILFAVLTIVVVYLVSEMFVAASQPLGWLGAAASIALVLAPAIRLLTRWLPRPLAIPIVVAAALALIATVGVGLYLQMERQLAELGATLPTAAQELEEAGDDDGVLAQLQFGSLVQGVVDDVTVRLLPEPDVDAVGSVPAYFLTGILSIFLLIWSVRLFEAAMRQIADPTRRARVARVVETAAHDAQLYVVGAIGVALVVGVAGGGLAWAAGLPSPFVLGVVLGVASLIPSLGVLFGGVPMVILSAAFEPALTTALLVTAVMVLQAGASIAYRTVISPRSVQVGPAVLVIAVLLGSELYGVGGALVAAVVAVVVVAVVEARVPCGSGSAVDIVR